MATEAAMAVPRPVGSAAVQCRIPGRGGVTNRFGADGRRDGRVVRVEAPAPDLAALLAFLLSFPADLPSAGNWRLSLRFQTAGVVHTAAVTITAG